MAVYQSSLLGEENVDEQAAGFEKILDIMVDPAVEMCINTSEEKKRIRPRWDQAVYVLNCLSYLQVFSPYFDRNPYPHLVFRCRVSWSRSRLRRRSSVKCRN
jgi:hypothetical protein